MKIRLLSLRIRIFIAMILLILLASILIAAVTIYQYKEQTDEYNEGRLERKEEAVKASINYWLNSGSGNTFPIVEENLKLIFREKVHEISDIEKLEINIYDLEGNIVKSSHSGFVKSDAPNKLSQEILYVVNNSYDHRYVNDKIINDSDLQYSYSFITDNKFKPIGILNLQYIQDNTDKEKDLEEFLVRMTYVYCFMFLLAIGLAYFISSYITRNIKAVTDKMKQTSLNKTNEKIILKDASAEIYTLVNAYNNMVNELENSALKLAKGEREQAWREMAKQVAHEIKNPLTPMRLTVQSFERKFDPNDPNIHEKMKEYSDSLIQQIDTMSSIASAFATYAQMPAQQDETLNVIKITKLALDIFNEGYIYFTSEKNEVIIKFDRTQLMRVITNLVKNSIQAIHENHLEEPKIEVRVYQDESFAIISVMDNGTGITDENKAMVF